MRIWPVIIDSHPDYLGRHDDGSLLLAPLGGSIVASHVRGWLGSATRNPPVVISPGQRSAGYEERIREIWPDVQIVHSPNACIDVVGGFEPSDALLIVDPSTLPIRGVELEELVEQYAAEPRAAHHLVALESVVAGTKERLTFDADGRVRGILRHYEPRTWPFISGVTATLLPVASGALSGPALPHSLAQVRRELAAHGVPSRDITIEGGAYDLGSERGLLAANEHAIQQLASQSGSRGPICVGSDHAIDETVRFVGHVVLHSGAVIEANATLIGPVLVGRGARVGSRAVVAAAVVGAGATIAPGHTLRDRTWFGHVRAHGNPRHVVAFSDRITTARSTPAIEVRRADPSLQRSLALKRALDVIASATALLLLSPVLLLAALLVRLDSKGPIFYGDKREGVGGRGFKCWKFRTMGVNADAVQKDLKSLTPIDGPHFKLDRDPRVTRVGRLLRASNVDELPQLFNVLVGEMSLVGPRPSPFRENQVCVPWREARLSVPPGITGMWQVCRHDRAAGDFHQWIEYDLLYVRNVSIWLDLKLLAATILTAGGKAGYVRPERLVPKAFSASRSQYAVGVRANGTVGEKTA